MNRRAWSMAAVAALVAAGSALAVPAMPATAAGVGLTTFGVAYSQDFGTLASTGTSSTVPPGWAFVETGGNANTTYRAGTGSDNTGDTYSFGASGSTERAFGGVLSGNLVPTIGVEITNTTGGTLTSLDVAYVGEQWRLGTAGRQDRLDLQYSTNATSLTTGTWIDVNSLDFAAPVTTGAVGLLNGNAVGNRTQLTGTIGGLTVATGGSVWIRWNDFNASGADDGLAVDDVSIVAGGFYEGEEAPAVASTVPADGATDVPANQNITVRFTEPVTVTDPWFSLTCATSGAHAASVSGGPLTFTLNPTVDFTYGEACTLVIDATKVADLDGLDPPDRMVIDFTAGFTTEADPCLRPVTPIPAIQGSGAASPIVSTVVTTRGVVVSDDEGPSPALRGFYLQDLAGDGDAATSDGIFVFNGNADDVDAGDVVAVTGTVQEFQGQTQVGNVTGVRVCGSVAAVEPTDVTFPLAAADALEAFEGMLVRLPQTMYVTEHFQLGRFGQVVLSAGGRLVQPTNVVLPGAPAAALQAANDLRKIILDDSSQAQNPDPIAFARGGQPLSASNTLRGGDTATGIVGVMTYTFGGATASPNAYRVRPLRAIGGDVDFQPANPRPTSVPAVGGTVRVVGMNLLNFFDTFDGLPDTVDNCGSGVSGGPTDCRGADTAAEFARQWPKTVAAILAMNPDVLGVNELENDGYGPNSSIRFLVDRLNEATAPGTYAFVDVDANTGQVDAMGSDAIRVAQLYKPAVVTPVGRTAALNSVAFVNGGDPAPRGRPSLAQAYEVNATGGRFVVDVNHFKSKGSACSTPDAGDGQGNCNEVRKNAARALVDWLATDPTGTGDPDVLLIGDYNSYAQEDPIRLIEGAGFSNLIKTRIGPDAYSYVFDGQWGYLDHAFASAGLDDQVVGVADYHINADEPSVLDYNTDFKTANLISTLYAPDQFRVSDHDPVVVGLTPNAPPKVTAAFAGSHVPCGANNGTLSLRIADPDAADVHTATIDWGDGTSQTVAGVPAIASIPHTYARPGIYTVTVSVTDGRHTVGLVAPLQVAVDYTSSGILQPVNADGTSVFKAGRTVPVKVRFVDCAGAARPDLAPTIKVTMLSGATPGLEINEPASTSAADTGGVLRFSDGQYIYNLSTAALPDPSATYRVTITVPATGQTVTATFGLRP